MAYPAESLSESNGSDITFTAYRQRCSVNQVTLHCDIFNERLTVSATHIPQQATAVCNLAGYALTSGSEWSRTTAPGERTKRTLASAPRALHGGESADVEVLALAEVAINGSCDGAIGGVGTCDMKSAAYCASCLVTLGFYKVVIQRLATLTADEFPNAGHMEMMSRVWDGVKSWLQHCYEQSELYGGGSKLHVRPVSSTVSCGLSSVLMGRLESTGTSGPRRSYMSTLRCRNARPFFQYQSSGRMSYFFTFLTSQSTRPVVAC